MNEGRRKQAKAERHPRHVLVADDGSEQAKRAGELAVTVAAATGARLTVLYVRKAGEGDAAAAEQLASTLATAAAAKVKVEVKVERPVGITNAGRRILTAATSVQADMIVVGARGSGLARKLLGSVSSYVVSHATISVAVVR